MHGEARHAPATRKTAGTHALGVTMLPPVEESVLKGNPSFAKLYRTLMTVSLNSDGSTKNDAGAKRRNAVQEELKKVRLQEAKRHVLVEAIAMAAPPPAAAAETKPGPASKRTTRPEAAVQASKSSDLPPDLADLLVFLPVLLRGGNDLFQDDGGGDDDDMALLLSSPPLSTLPEHLPQLAVLVSTVLRTQALGLARVVNPTTNPSFLHRVVPSLPAHVAALRTQLEEARQRVAEARQAAATSALTLLDRQAAALATLLRVLEAKHGPVARSLELRAAEAALEAQTREAQAQVTLASTQRAIYPNAETAAALQAYARHLQDSRMRLEEAVRQRKAILAEYGVDMADTGEGGSATEHANNKERTMREMARVYRQMGKQVQEIQGDLARLGA